ncbi:MAG: hypothetical protein M3Y07_18360, partial [Acidobacteriota bacterium]|nr:hypothetical protein [Acidobacteriota bacterium]
SAALAVLPSDPVEALGKADARPANGATPDPIPARRNSRQPLYSGCGVEIIAYYPPLTEVDPSVESHAEASAPPRAVPDKAAPPQSAELAFAAKITPKVPTQPEERDPAVPPPTPAPREQFRGIVQELPPALREPRQAESKSEIREPSRVLDPLPEPPAAKTADAMRDISLRLTDASKEQVEVRLFERSGELRVSVHSGDAQLNSELRNGLGDLAGKLEKSGFETETWRPSPETQHQGRHGQQGQGGQPREETQQSRNRRINRPKWVEEIGDRSK